MVYSRSEIVTFEVRIMRWWRNMTRKLRHDFEMSGHIGPPTWISKFLQNTLKLSKLIKN